MRWLTLLALGIVLASPIAAVGHSALRSSSPPADGTAPWPLDTVTLTFGRAVAVLPDSVIAIGDDGVPRVADDIGVTDGTVVTARWADPLPEGTSTISWRVVGGDGHPIDGSYAITLLPPTAPPVRDPQPTETAAAVVPPAGDERGMPSEATAAPASLPDDDPPTRSAHEPLTSPLPPHPPPLDLTTAPRASAPDPGPLRREPAAPRVVQTSGRWLAFTSILTALGVAVFGITVHPDGRRDQALLSRLLAWSAAGVCLGAVVQLLGHVAVLGGQGLTGAVDPAAWRITRGSGPLIAAVLRVGGALTMLLAARGRRGWADAPARTGPVVVGGLALLASFQFTGHTATSSPEGVVRLAGLAHVAGAAVWTGGVLALAAVLRARRHRGEDGAGVAARFSVAAAGAVVLVGAAGLALAAVEISHISQLVTTGYGRVLTAKLALVLAIGAVGAHNHRRLVPRVVAGEVAARAALGRAMRLELALFALTLGLTAVLVGLSAS